jgi:hypothetical protein
VRLKLRKKRAELKQEDALLTQQIQLYHIVLGYEDRACDQAGGSPRKTKIENGFEGTCCKLL